MKKFYKTYIKMHLPKPLRKCISRFTSIFRKEKENIHIKQINEALYNWHKVWQYPLFPYLWANEYKAKNFSCEKDENCKLFYAESQGLKLYFPKVYDVDVDVDEECQRKGCQNSAAFFAMEQDLLSPHRYVTKENKMWGTLERNENEIPKETAFFVEQGDIVADIGASNGNFSISVVEKAKHIYLFEADKIWNEPLQKTFEKYKDKITIVNKYVSDVDGENSVTLDTFFKDKEVNFIKIDIEGYEQQLLNGAKNVLQRKNVKCSICTYHKTQDAKDFENFFKELGYETYFTDGYMFLPFECSPNGLQSPNPSYLRKAVLRVRKMQTST
ncbi:MAG: FkbM family methyltransferase [Fibromonadaceae bacterium]|jgi:predicted RNA methylase|nr:FkbM family methyltransferase [Fibromonadaceae bacterium]